MGRMKNYLKEEDLSIQAKGRFGLSVKNWPWSWNSPSQIPAFGAFLKSA